MRQLLGDGDINLTFRRNFSAAEIEEWEDEELLDKINGVTLSNTKDSMTCVFERAGAYTSYTTAILYREFAIPRMIYHWLMMIWEAKIRLKIKIFLW